ncbi:hypothetical protein [Polyangium sp. 6x1]|uniref:hypothetical protein n=1 Tax=Polyangium sp. 6x1 TaxID=3042689 RepID=UPI0024829C41|nr:hypothetical protein [Polyangium sp. 6x1]MDI1449533.1 hypothetical protein [Polyangium sp. 6x1]
MSRASAPAGRAEWLCHVASALPGVCLALAAGAGLVGEKAALYVFSLSFVGLNLAHMAATWSRVYLDPRGLRDAMFERVFVPALLVAFALGAEAVGYGAALLGAQYYLSLHHAMMQNYGLSRALQRRAGRSLSPLALRIDQAACLLLPLGALLYRARAVCHTYSTAPLLTPPLALVLAVSVAGALALCIHVTREILAFRRGEPVDPLGPAIVVSQSLFWSALPVLIEHPAIPLYALASGHYVQYLYFVWKFERSRPGLGVVPAWLRARVAPPSRLAYLVALTGLGGGVVVLLSLGSVAVRAAAEASGLRPADALPLPPWAAAMLGVNLAHYWLDHRIWRFRAAPSGERAALPQPA